MNVVIAKEFALPEINRKEVLRYMGCRHGNAEIDALIDRCIALCEDTLTNKVCFARYDLAVADGILDLGFCKVQSSDLAKCLQGCDGILLLAATVGLALDRLILRYGKIEPSVSICLQAIGAERIEALCDAFCLEMKEKYALENRELRPRFSAGYGDLPIEVQKDIFAALSCDKHIGLTLNDSLIMSPTKSVTAIIGIVGKT